MTDHIDRRIVQLQYSVVYRRLPPAESSRQELFSVTGTINHCRWRRRRPWTGDSAGDWTFSSPLHTVESQHSLQLIWL